MNRKFLEQMQAPLLPRTRRSSFNMALLGLICILRSHLCKCEHFTITVHCADGMKGVRCALDNLYRWLGKKRMKTF